VSVRYGLAAGVSVQPLGDIWAAFSALSGETLLLNDESAAILEILMQGSACDDKVIDELAVESGTDRAKIAEALAGCWPRLLEAGLLRVHNGVVIESVSGGAAPDLVEPC
jgi:PqqD family protein of HPr-rel-A system